MHRKPLILCRSLRDSNPRYSLERAGSASQASSDRRGIIVVIDDSSSFALSQDLDMFHHIRSSGTPSVETASWAAPHPITACSSRSRIRAAVSLGTSS